jgi:hypothetical protein
MTFWASLVNPTEFCLSMAVTASSRMVCASATDGSVLGLLDADGLPEPGLADADVDVRDGDGSGVGEAASGELVQLATRVSPPAISSDAMPR